MRLRPAATGLEAFLSRNRVFPLCSEQVSTASEIVLTTDVGVRHELVPPRFCDVNHLLLLSLGFGRHSLLVCVLEYIRHVLRLNGVQDIPEVIAIWQTAIRGGVRHVHHEFIICLDSRPKLLHGELVIVRHVHIFDLFELEKSFLVLKDPLDKVLVDHILGRHVELQVFREVLDEVSLGSELADQFCDHDSPLLCAIE